MNRLLFFSLIFCLFNCSDRKDFEDGENVVFQYASTVSDQDPFLKCNIFSDETFQGKVRPDITPVGKYNPDCVRVDISKAPASLFKTEDLYLQAYPFSFENKERTYGPSLDIKIYKKSAKNLDDMLFKAHLVDKHLIEKSIKSSSESFFNDHYLKFCGMGEKWEGMQLVVYFEGEEKTLPVRVTRFLTPPFLSDPYQFELQKGIQFSALHPFLKLKGQKEVFEFNDLSSYICEQ